ncbi:MAG TPA: L-serine ammonia-lyase, iron-sulfur-dependent, subunit alpha [Candidatus Onthenecus intestinigallinarum]|uniref:L-serine dehydratase n=1 Tax=Candidatus Onthenecus intestinigallinarum TaxID=2840875 RepID=A0A9D0Z7Y4_9FIRM|nr:L-serine ammonia-lyase, iron-sulfur-dependent, subunit alpha [Candidatus Onthenecus intestinigallinarum]
MRLSAQQPLWRAVLLADCEERQADEAASFERMRAMLRAMRAADDGYAPGERSRSGLVGGDGGRMAAYAASGHTVCGPLVCDVIARALKMGESNACMKRIVAAPTAGACGVLPAVLLSYADARGADEDALVRALFVAAGVGQVVATRAFIAGAAGGCQAEIGTAAAMAAAALTDLCGGAPEAAAHAAAMALKNLLGLVCDPVAGLVEVPCVKRNVGGAMVALSAAEMALAGIRSAIPPDEVVDAMREVGEKMDASLRETGEGGLAATPCGRAARDKL